METWKKVAVGTVVGGTLIGGGYLLMKFNRISAELETVPTLKIHKLDLSKAKLRQAQKWRFQRRGSFTLLFNSGLRDQVAGVYRQFAEYEILNDGPFFVIFKTHV